MSRRLHKVEQNLKMGNSGKRDKKRKRVAADLSGDDTGNPLPVHKEKRRRKRPLIVGIYVCVECGMQFRTRSMTEQVLTTTGTNSAPEWRKGQQGAKTLCNACGLKWSKAEMKLQNRNGNPSVPEVAGPSFGKLVNITICELTV